MRYLLPKYYQRFINEYPIAIVNGLPLYSNVESADGYDIESANDLIKFLKPDLPNHFIVIRYNEQRALLISNENIEIVDGALYEVDLAQQMSQPVSLDISFGEYVRTFNDWTDKLNNTLRTIKDHIERSEKNATESGKRSLKARNWKVVRSAVHDYIVALLVFRYNEEHNSMEVSSFIVTDHPNYERGHGLRAALNIIYSSAFKHGSSLEIRFVKDSSAKIKNAVPESIINFAALNGIKLDRKKSVLSHEVGLKIYTVISGGISEIKDVLENLKKKTNITLPALCFLSCLRIWETHEIKYILNNSLNPEGLLFGKVFPETWNLFEMAVQLGGNVIAVTMFRNNIETLLEEVNGKSIIDSIGDYFTLEVTKSLKADLISFKCDTECINKKTKYIVLPRIRRMYLNEDIEKDLEYIDTCLTGQKIVLIYTQEIKRSSITVEQLESRKNLSIYILPFSINELEEKVIKRMKRTKSLRT